MNISRKFKLILILTSAAALLLFAGCDLFVLGPSLNLNYDDPDQGFYRFDCALIEDDQVRVSWDWLDLERKLRFIDPVYDKIIIQHSRGSYPASRIGGRVIKIDEWDIVANPLWSTVFSDLKYDKEHYFALYAHERNGRWMAPIYTSINVGDFQKYSIPLIARDDGSKVPLRINTVIDETNHLTTAQWAISPVRGHIFYYDLWEGEKVVSALLSFDISGIPAPPPDTYIRVFPMRAYWDTSSGVSTSLGLSGDESFVIDRSIKAEALIPGDGSYTIDISEVFAKAQQFRHNGIIIFTSEPVQMEYGTDFPTIDLQVVRNDN